VRLTTILDPRLNFSATERIQRLQELALISLAHRLPYALRYRVYIDFAVQHLRPDDVVPDVRMTEILQRAR